MRKKPNQNPSLTLRALNRAYLARQHLLARTTDAPLKVIEHLLGLQAQAPFAPYFGLWSRIEAFTPDALADLLLNRRVVRIALMRGTVHLVTARDCLRLREPIQPVLQRSFTGNWAKQVAGADLEEIAEAARGLVEDAPRTGKQLADALGPRWPEANPQALSQTARALLPLVQVPPRAIWGKSGQATLTTAQAWLKKPLGPPLTLEALFLRYLAAFGPATPKDAQVWSGLTGFTAVAERLRPRLTTFTGPDGRELFDLPDAPRPPEDTPAPVRLVAEYDNLILSHDVRTRVVDDASRKRFFTVNGIFPGTVLVDGFVRGTWALSATRQHTTLRLTPYQPLSRKDRAELSEEGERLLRFAAAGARKTAITFART